MDDVWEAGDRPLSAAVAERARKQAEKDAKDNE